MSFILNLRVLTEQVRRTQLQWLNFRLQSNDVHYKADSLQDVQTDMERITVITPQDQCAYAFFDANRLHFSSVAPFHAHQCCIVLSNAHHSYVCPHAPGTDTALRDWQRYWHTMSTTSGNNSSMISSPGAQQPVQCVFYFDWDVKLVLLYWLMFHFHPEGIQRVFSLQPCASLSYISSRFRCTVKPRLTIRISDSQYHLWRALDVNPFVLIAQDIQPALVLLASTSGDSANAPLRCDDMHDDDDEDDDDDDIHISANHTERISALAHATIVALLLMCRAWLYRAHSSIVIRRRLTDIYWTSELAQQPYSRCDDEMQKARIATRGIADALCTGDWKKMNINVQSHLTSVDWTTVMNALYRIAPVFSLPASRRLFPHFIAHDCILDARSVIQVLLANGRMDESRYVIDLNNDLRGVLVSNLLQSHAIAHVRHLWQPTPRSMGLIYAQHNNAASTMNRDALFIYGTHAAMYAINGLGLLRSLHTMRAYDDDDNRDNVSGKVNDVLHLPIQCVRIPALHDLLLSIAYAAERSACLRLFSADVSALKSVTDINARSFEHRRVLHCAWVAQTMSTLCNTTGCSTANTTDEVMELSHPAHVGALYRIVNWIHMSWNSTQRNTLYQAALRCFLHALCFWCAHSCTHRILISDDRRQRLCALYNEWNQSLASVDIAPKGTESKTGMCRMMNAFNNMRITKCAQCMLPARLLMADDDCGENMELRDVSRDMLLADDIQHESEHPESCRMNVDRDSDERALLSIVTDDKLDDIFTGLSDAIHVLTHIHTETRREMCTEKLRALFRELIHLFVVQLPFTSDEMNCIAPICVHSGERFQSNEWGVMSFMTESWANAYESPAGMLALYLGRAVHVAANLTTKNVRVVASKSALSQIVDLTAGNPDIAPTGNNLVPNVLVSANQMSAHNGGGVHFMRAWFAPRSPDCNIALSPRMQESYAHLKQMMQRDSATDWQRMQKGVRAWMRAHPPGSSGSSNRDTHSASCTQTPLLAGRKRLRNAEV